MEIIPGIDSIQRNIADQLIEVLQNNKEIAKYNFKNNFICDKIAEEMLEKIKTNKVIFIMDMPECLSFKLKSQYAEVMKKRKPKKKAKKGSKGAKGAKGTKKK